MFDFAWSEIAIIGVVALVAIGPKDMPVALRAVAGMVKKARKMASEFQTHVDQMVKDADLGDLKNQIDDIRNFARGQGMTTLREAGLKLIFDGVTTIDEVVRETVMEDAG